MQTYRYLPRSRRACGSDVRRRRERGRMDLRGSTACAEYWRVRASVVGWCSPNVDVLAKIYMKTLPRTARTVASIVVHLQSRNRFDSHYFSAIRGVRFHRVYLFSIITGRESQTRHEIRRKALYFRERFTGGKIVQK